MGQTVLPSENKQGTLQNITFTDFDIRLLMHHNKGAYLTGYALREYIHHTKGEVQAIVERFPNYKKL